MTSDEFQELWKAYDAKLEKTMLLNRKLMEEVGTQKLRRQFNWLIFGKCCIIGWGVLWNIVCGSLAWRFRSEPMFVVAAVGVIGFTSYSIAGYTTQVLLLLQINLSKSILDTQKQLAWLEALMVRTLRVSFLQAPFYTIFYISKQMMANAGPGFWIIQGLVTGAFVVAVVWLYRNVRVGNAQKRWMRTLVKNEGGNSIARAREFIREAEEWGKEGGAA